MTTKLPSSEPSPRRGFHPWVYDLLLVYILLAGAYFRLSGLLWGEYQYLHPDERFLVWVGTDISPVHSLSEYFDTAHSTLNPHNVGHGFYVYGTLPMFITRYMVQWAFGHSGFNEMTQMGRTLSVAADLLTVLLVYLMIQRLYDKRVAVLASAFSAAAVLQIQQSHFFTMDTFIVAFSFLAFYFAVRVLTAKGAWTQEKTTFRFFRDPLLLPSLGFGLALGMAVASKLNAAPMAVTLPIAMALGLLKMPVNERYRRAVQAFIYLVIAAVVSLLVFRILQPYTFSGPGFFGLKPNPLWVDNIKSLRAQSTGDVDFPPAMQWARRLIYFSLQNLVMWGLGLPLGFLAWSGFLWVAWRLWKGWKQHNDEWLSHALIWIWTAAYFTWQSLQRNPTMRYQLPIYPTLAIFAALAIIMLYDRGRAARTTASSESGPVPAAGDSSSLIEASSSTVDVPSTAFPRRASVAYRLLSVLIAGVVLIATFAYAYAFSRLYTRPITRIEASRWIYANIPGPINLPIQTDQETFNQLIPFPYSLTISPGVPYLYAFQPRVAGTLSQVYLPHVSEVQGTHEVRTLTLSISSDQSEEPLATATLVDDLTPSEDPSGKGYTLALDKPVTLDSQKKYNLQLSMPGEATVVALGGVVTLVVQPATGIPSTEPLEIPLSTSGTVLYPNSPSSAVFTAPADGSLAALKLPVLLNQSIPSQPISLTLSLRASDETTEPLVSSLSIQQDPKSQGYLLVLQQPQMLVSGVDYLLSLELLPAGGSISLSGSGIANEGEWDDGLPLRMDNYDGFGGYYPLDLGFNMYWDDNPEKMARFTRILDQSDYVVITSSRQWGSLPRMPERFPMTSLYYRNLIGCPLTMVIEDCYRVAQPGMFQGGLGFELIQVFESPPRLGGLRLNDQYAEEAFTVYDHPKVLIFKKTQNYNSQQVHTLLATVDFSHIIRKAPMRYKMRPEDLLLPDYRWAEQRLGGTWSELFNTNNLQNRFPALSVVLWYISVALLGLITYPLLRFALPGLADGAYPLARTAGMLILSYIVWIAGSLRIPFSRPTISAALVLMLLLGCFLAYRQREELRQLWRSHRRYFLIVEGLTLAFFLFDLFIRYGNPDLWHPWKGGEKPMDFSYFNAVLKSTSFPPYDPWYAGGYLNYYYYGFVIVGVLVKWLGIVPSVAYNLILPTLFSMIAMGAFSVVWNLVASRKRSSRGEAGADPQDSQSATASTGVTLSTILPSIGAALGMAVLGNLGTVRMIFQGYQKLVAPEGVIENASLLTHWVWAARGFIQVIQGARLPYGIGDWYWIPSRAIPAPGDVEPITEFPFFTVLYADLHAHLIALPITLLALACIISILLSQARWKSWLSALSGFVLAGLAIGALRPTNTWDFYPYLILSLVVVGYTLWMNLPQVEKIPQVMTKIISTSWLRLLVTLGGMALLAGLAFVLYQPYSHWYALGYDKVDLWKGTHTPLSSYLTHWGLFLFLIVSWMAWETIDWMAKTPISSLRKLQPYRNLILVCVALLLILIVGQLGLGLYIAWFLPGGDVPSRLSQLAVPISGFALPLAAWAGILLLRPRQPDAKRFVLFLVGTGLVLTFTVEVIVLRGDIGRMNTVFKFYLQVWTFFAVSAAAALGWLLPLLPAWSPSWRKAWQIALGVLVACAALYTLMATMAKIEDRMSDTAPHTLDGIAFINYSTYNDQWGAMDLSQDYRAILWMQENVYGSPVIVEANLRQLYRWGSRYTIYTGLPGVVGWEWHQQQQRAVVPATWVTDRIMEIADFYTTTDWQLAQAFLRKYQVSYIIVGQQERGMYPGPGLDKFPAANGVLWSEVYRDGNTVIYQVEGP